MKRFRQKKNIFEVNPHYFGKIKKHNKNPITNFIIVGEISAKRKSHSLLISSVKQMVQQGISNFKITLIGKGELKNIPAEIHSYFDIKGRLSYPKMYNEIQKADYFLPLLDPEKKEHNRYIETGSSGSFQLIYGFNIPCLLANKFAKVYGFTDENSIIYNTNSDLVRAMEKAINLTEDEYVLLKERLKERSATIYRTSLKNLESAVKRKYF